MRSADFMKRFLGTLLLSVFLMSCQSDEDQLTGTLKVKYSTTIPDDLKVVVCPADNPDLSIKSTSIPNKEGEYVFSLNPGNYILVSSTGTYFPRVGFQIQAGKTTEVIFDYNHNGTVQ